MINNICMCCGEIIPEGREICWSCEHGYTPNKKEEEEKGDEEN